MTRLTYDRLIHSLVMIRLGQELGTSSDAAQTVAGVIEAILAAARLALDHF